MDLKLNGRVAIVTGGSKGIGLAVVRTLIEEGAFVVAASRSISPDLQSLDGPNLLHVSGDVIDPTFPAHLVERTVEAFGGLDILVNNAGGPPPGVVLPRGPFLDGGDTDWQAVFEFNLFAVMRLTRAALPHLLERGGTVVNVSSTLSRQPATNNYEYAAAKAALSHAAKALAEEFGPRGVRVNTVSPGVVRTNWWTDEGGVADTFAGAMGVDRDTLLDKTLPEMLRLSTGRFVEAQEVADAVAVLASPRAGSTNGADYVVDPAAPVGVATGMAYPDALTGGAFMASVGGPLLLTEPKTPSAAMTGALSMRVGTTDGVFVFGGPNAVSAAVFNSVVATVKGVVVKF